MSVEKYLVTTDNGDVVVIIDRSVGGLDSGFITLRTPEEGEAFEMVTPLRAFNSKMVDLISVCAQDALPASPTIRDMVIGEKAASELNRIEKFARTQSSSSSETSSPRS